MPKTRNSRIYLLCPLGVDATTSYINRFAVGTEVQKTQPYGCPRNGTMGCCYVQVAETGEFIGLVSQISLIKTEKIAPLRDLAAEARDRLHRYVRS